MISAIRMWGSQVPLCGLRKDNCVARSQTCIGGQPESRCWSCWSPAGGRWYRRPSLHQRKCSAACGGHSRGCMPQWPGLRCNVTMHREVHRKLTGHGTQNQTQLLSSRWIAAVNAAIAAGARKSLSGPASLRDASLLSVSTSSQRPGHLPRLASLLL
jgi:hypothetical protein